MAVLSEGRLAERLREAARRFASETAVIEQGRRLDFATFDAQSDRVASALRERGVRDGDRVALHCVNSAAFALTYCGILKSGAIAVPINLLFSPREIAYILSDARARLLLFHPSVSEPVTQLSALGLSSVPSLQIAQRSPGEIELEGDGSLAEPAGEGASGTGDLAAILYTSGTTGQPKGAMLTHGNLIRNTQSVARGLGLTPGRDVVLLVLPMFHAFAATVGMLTPLLHGLTFVPLPRFEPRSVADAIARCGASVFLGVPSMFSLLLRLPEEDTEKIAGLRFCVSGGAALPVEVMERFERRFGVPIYEGDGPTECSPVTCVNPIGGIRKPGSVGLPIPDVEMRVVDERGAELARGQVGEVCVRGPNVMKGYWGRPQDTAATFFGDWFRTGDLGYQDADGYFYLVDRKKDIVIVNGMNVYPRMVEEVLYRHPAIAEAAVVGEPDELHGEIPIAYVSLRDGAEVSEGEIRAFCRDHLGRHEVPRRVLFLTELPKTSTGKVLKRALRTSGERERGIVTGR